MYKYGNKIMMYGCTAAAASWMVLGVVSGVTDAYFVGLAFIALAFLYWDGS